MNEATQKFGADFASMIFNQKLPEVMTDPAEIDVAVAYAKMLWSKGACEAATLIYCCIPVDKLPKKDLDEGLGNALIVELAARLDMDSKLVDRLVGIFMKSPIDKIGRRARIISLYVLCKQSFERDYRNTEQIRRLAETIIDDPKYEADLWEYLIKGNLPYVLAACYVIADPVRYAADALKWMQKHPINAGTVPQSGSVAMKNGGEFVLDAEELMRSVEAWEKRERAIVAAPWVAFFASSLTLVIGLVFGSSVFHSSARIPLTFWFVAAGLFFLFWKKYPKWHSERSAN